MMKRKPENDNKTRVVFYMYPFSSYLPEFEFIYSYFYTFNYVYCGVFWKNAYDLLAASQHRSATACNICTIKYLSIVCACLHNNFSPHRGVYGWVAGRIYVRVNVSFRLSICLFFFFFVLLFIIHFSY